jgi:1,4-dihydroxy-2-naphthoyl-CoA hydrolase
MQVTAGEINAKIQGRLAGSLGVELLEVSSSEVVSRLVLRDELLNTMGSLHAAAIVAIADTSCGAGCIASLPDGQSFTTLELKTNFVQSARQGAIRCVARLRHAGKTTQLWEATVSDEATGKPLAFFTCTELIRAPSGA